MKIVTFGDLVLKLSAPDKYRLFQTNVLNCIFSGSEANVAVSLSRFGLESRYVTKLPSTDVGYAARDTIRKYGVDTSKIIFGEGRLGLYYVEKGASQRSSKVIYDRQNSVFVNSNIDDYNWEEIFKDATWFHFSGINPALSNSVKYVCLQACKIAKDLGLTISCDLNYRNKLWNHEKARNEMKSLMPYIDICIGNEEDADAMLGIKSKSSDIYSGNINVNEYVDVARQICTKYGCKKASLTLRESYSADTNGWQAIIYDGSTDCYAISNHYDIQLVDRMGGGDSYSAGLIYGLTMGMSDVDSINFAIAASCIKQTIPDDYNLSSVEEITALVKNGGCGRIQR